MFLLHCLHSQRIRGMYVFAQQPFGELERIIGSLMIKMPTILRSVQTPVKIIL